MKTGALAALVALVSAGAHAAPTRVTFHGHAAFEIVTPSGKVLMIDPWLKNPQNPDKDPLKAVRKLDYILVTHGHFDHVGDAVELAKKTGARFVGSFELGTNLARTLGFPSKQMGFDTLGNIGGELKLPGNEVAVRFVPAVHSSGLEAPDAEEAGEPMIYGGNPVGFVLRIEGGPTIYHSGDTAFFRDLELIGQTGGVDLALINIGGHFGMEPPDAVRAARAVKAKLVVPHHYRSLPVLTQDPSEFFRLLDQAKIAHVDLQPGKSLVFEGRTLQK